MESIAHHERTERIQPHIPVFDVLGEAFPSWVGFLSNITKQVFKCDYHHTRKVHDSNILVTYSSRYRSVSYFVGYTYRKASAIVGSCGSESGEESFPILLDEHSGRKLFRSGCPSVTAGCDLTHIQRHRGMSNLYPGNDLDHMRRRAKFPVCHPGKLGRS